MKINLSFIIILLFLTISSVKLFAQKNIEFDETTFAGRGKQLKKALKAIYSGDKLMTGRARKAKGIGRYEGAIKYYLIANDINSDNALLNYKIGYCYLKTVEKTKAQLYLEKSYQLNRNVKADINYLLGQAYQYNYDFDKAILKFLEYQRGLNAFDREVLGPKVEKKIQECRNGKDLIKNPINVKISNLGSNVNTLYPEYSPIVNADKTVMFFTSRRSNTTGKRIDVNDGKYYEDIYISYYKDGAWTKPRNPGRPLNTRTHDAIVGVSKDGKTLLTYKANPRDNGDIYISRLKEDKYTRPKRLNENINTPYHESSATMSPDGNILYFVSDREGGFGGRDIWMSKKDSKGEWGRPMNLGNTVNTSYNEEGVFMQADGKTLYFSSQGHNSMGGYDIFKTVYENGKWSVPRNIGYPINTPDDDVFLSITQDGRHGYYASAKKDGFGDLDIYDIDFFETKEPEVVLISGKVLDADTKLPVESKIEIKDKEADAVEINLTSEPESGNYFASLPNTKTYLINVTAPDYVDYQEVIPKGKPVNKIIYIHKIKTTVNGYIYDGETKNPVCGAKIKIINMGAVADTMTSECKSGQYHSDVLKGKPYDVLVSADGYVPYKESIPADKDVNKIIYIDKIKTAAAKGKIFDITQSKTFVLPDILYDLDKYDLKPQYQDSLNGLINTMNAFPNIVVELGSHTDTRASDPYNLKLSYNRAKSVVDYLIFKGIDPDRLVAKGYGKRVSRVLDKTRYVMSCDKKFTFPKGTKITDAYILSLKGGKCEMEAAHQLNRRTEFKVLREDYVTKKEKTFAPVNIDVVK